MRKDLATQWKVYTGVIPPVFLQRSLWPFTQVNKHWEKWAVNQEVDYDIWGFKVSSWILLLEKGYMWVRNFSPGLSQSESTGSINPCCEKLSEYLWNFQDIISKTIPYPTGERMDGSRSPSTPFNSPAMTWLKRMTQPVNVNQTLNTTSMTNKVLESVLQDGMNFMWETTGYEWYKA